MRASIPFILVATTVLTPLFGCSGGDPNSLMTADPASSEDPLKGGNCSKSHSPHCTDGGRADAGRGDDGDDHEDGGDDDDDHDGGSTKDSGATRDAGKTIDSGTPADAGTPPAPPPPTPTPVTCTSFTYSAFGACQPNGTQTRTVVSASPAGCTGGTPVLTQACTYVDGAALYTQYCAGCHGTSKKGSSASSIQTAINNNVGGMGSLKFLTSAQIAAISAAP